MIAHDPLSLLFLACFLFSGGFLAISTLLGGQHHAGHIHLGGHILHIGHSAGHGAGHIHIGHGAHAGHVQIGHGAQAGHGAPAAHTASAQANGSAGAAASAQAPAPWQGVSQTLESGLNLYGILMFLVVFGLLGYLFHNFTNVGAFISIVLPALFGAGAALTVGNLLFRLFLPGAESELSPESSRLEGRLGQVSMTIREGGIGEVIFTRPGGGRQSVGARSTDGAPIPSGTEIVILGYRNGIASVQTWDRFMINVRSGREPLLEPIDPQP